MIIRISARRLVGATASLLFAAVAGAGTITVNSDSGTRNSAALCVLRDAITTANTGTPTGACTIAEPPPPTVPDSTDCLCTTNTIVLPAGATIVLTEVDDVTENTGLPSIIASLTITGNGSTIERDGTLGCNRDGIADPGEFALIHNGTLLVLDHLTLANGCADSADYPFAKGGAITNDGALVLQHVTLSNNWASNRGGALYDDGFSDGAGSVSISDSLLSSNASTAGGAIYLEGTSATLTVQRSLFLLNSASPYFAGGAIQAGLSTTMNVTNSTFSQNSAGSGAAIEADGIVAISNSTIAENDANAGAFQISTSGAGQQATIKNSLFAANTGAAGNCAFAGGSVTIAGTNLADDSSCTGFSLGATDPKLLPLADNGGRTRTYALQSSSPAVDAVLDCSDTNGFALSVDQRSAARPVAILALAAQCDVGAFELGDNVFHEGFDGGIAN